MSRKSNEKSHPNFNQNLQPEVRAYIYQQLSSLDSILPEGAKSNVDISLGKKSGTDLFRVSIQLEAKGLVLRGSHSDPNVFTAISVVKDQLLGALEQISGIMINNRERKQKIRSMTRGYLLH